MKSNVARRRSFFSVAFARSELLHRTGVLDSCLWGQVRFLFFCCSRSVIVMTKLESLDR
jgi:hypothetical protein